MTEQEDESVHLVITSPPYWQLKDYGSGDQIGFDHSYEEYINNLNLVWNECNRVLHKGCRLCINIGDQFARSVYYGRYKVIPIRTEIIKFCETIGFDYMGAIIWQKVTTTNTSGGASIMGSFPYPRNGILKLDYEFILIFKKCGKSPEVSGEIKEQSKMTTEEWNTYFAGHWNFPGERQDKHLAMFPVELPSRLIKMFSFAGETVMDPFLGSGTTSLAAKSLDRNSVGFEINPDFIPIIKNKIQSSQIDIFEDSEIEIINQAESKPDYSDEIAELPYIFRDPVQFDKKVDPRNLQFGSKINARSSQPKEYFKVKNILSPSALALDNGLKIKLLGIREINEKNEEAISYLRDKTKGQRVYIEYDKTGNEQEDMKYCYLYLRNKTFINAHLIKNGLADADEEMEYGKKKQFLKYAGERHQKSA
jgi:site-specific DNA-methyltransferase (adenine-specific)